MKKNTAYFKPENTKSRLKIETLVRKKYPSISEKELNSVIDDLKRFAGTIHRIAKEPQFRAYYRERKRGGKILRQKMTDFDVKELKKILKDKPNTALIDMFRELERIKQKDER